MTSKAEELGIGIDDNHTGEHDLPIKIMDNVHAVSAGWYTHHVIMADGSLRQMSYNEYNILSSWQLTED